MQLRHSVTASQRLHKDNTLFRENNEDFFAFSCFK